MKLTRQRLRRLIINLINENSKRYIVNKAGEVTPADDAFQRALEKDKAALGFHSEIDRMIKSTSPSERRQARELAHSLAPPKSTLAKLGDLTDEEEIAIDQIGAAKSKEQSQVSIQFNDQALMNALKSKSVNLLKNFGFEYYKNSIDPHNNYQGHGDYFRLEAKTLGCKISNLMWISDLPELGHYKTFEAIKRLLEKTGAADKPNWVFNNIDPFRYKLYNLEGVKILHSIIPGFETFIICGY